jgi:putative toxin-antitoxin system antitoxin component (TIGR02293 family)
MSDVTVESLLGGPKAIGSSIRSEMDYYTISRKGIKKRALINLAANLDISLRAIAALLNVTERTLQRKGDSDLLDGTTTEQVLQIAEVFSRGNEVFGSGADFREWIGSENKALGDKRPMELLSSRFGAQMVLDVLGRIEYGVFS